MQMKKVISIVLCILLTSVTCLTCFCTGTNENVTYVEQNIYELVELLNEMCDATFNEETLTFTLTNFKESHKRTIQGLNYYAVEFTGTKVLTETNTEDMQCVDYYGTETDPYIHYWDVLTKEYGTICVTDFTQNAYTTCVVPLEILFFGTLQGDWTQERAQAYYNDYCTYEEPVPSVTETILETVTTSLTTIATSLGGGISALITSAMITDGNLSNFGTYVFVILGISLGIGVAQFVVDYVTSFGKVKRRRERHEEEDD